jgi:hypothetical protein
MRRDGTTKEGDMSNWDSGFIRLDLTNPAQPVVVGRTVYPSDADGDGHSSQYDEGRELPITADEDFCRNRSVATARRLARHRRSGGR